MENTPNPRRRVYHFLSLAVIASSLFVEEAAFKIALLLLGITGLLLIAVANKQKTLIYVYAGLMAVAVTVYFLFLRR